MRSDPEIVWGCSLRPSQRLFGISSVIDERSGGLLMRSVEVVEAPQARLDAGMTSGSLKERADALQELIIDPSITAIFFTMGDLTQRSCCLCSIRLQSRRT